MKNEYDLSKGERGRFHNPDGEFIVPKRDMLPLYEFQLRMARANRDNVFAHFPNLKEQFTNTSTTYISTTSRPKKLMTTTLNLQAASRPEVEEIMAYFPALIPKSLIPPKVEIIEA